MHVIILPLIKNASKLSSKIENLEEIRNRWYNFIKDIRKDDGLIIKFQNYNILRSFLIYILGISFLNYQRILR